MANNKENAIYLYMYTYIYSYKRSHIRIEYTTWHRPINLILLGAYGFRYESCIYDEFNMDTHYRRDNDQCDRSDLISSRHAGWMSAETNLSIDSRSRLPVMVLAATPLPAVNESVSTVLLASLSSFHYIRSQVLVAIGHENATQLLVFGSTYRLRCRFFALANKIARIRAIVTKVLNSRSQMRDDHSYNVYRKMVFNLFFEDTSWLHQLWIDYLTIFRYFYFPKRSFQQHGDHIYSRLPVGFVPTAIRLGD